MVEYRKYRGKTFNEARIKWAVDTVGKETFLIKQEIVKVGGFAGFGGHSEYELTCSIMEGSKYKKKAEEVSEDNIDYVTEAFNILEKKADERKTKKVENERIQIVNEKPKNEDFFHQKQTVDPSINNLQVEVNQLKELIYTFITRKGQDQDILKTDELKIKIDESDEKPSSFKDLFKVFLKNKEFEDSFIDDIINEYNFDDISVNLNSIEQGIDTIQKLLKQYLVEHLNVGNINLKEIEPNIIFFVGPTGVGKTSTLAKMGANLGIFDKKKVKFISLDTFKIGGSQQLKLFADWMEIHFEKINKVEDFKNSIEYDNDYDLILVDTSGHSQKNVKEIEKVKKYIQCIKNVNVQICLLLSVTSRYKDIVEILEKYSILEYENILLTKLDETNGLGPITSALINQTKKLTHISFGQNVPEDIEEITLEGIVDRIVKSIY